MTENQLSSCMSIQEDVLKLRVENKQLKAQIEQKKENKLFDLSKFNEWFALTYRPVNCGGKVPKVISFKEHIRILKEKENEHLILLNEYNKLVDDFNCLQEEFLEATGEIYIRKEDVEG